jgi:hypothetical protein
MAPQQQETSQRDVEEGTSPMACATVVNDLSNYEGISLNEKVDSFIKKHAVVMINRSWCLFSIDALDFLVQFGVDVYSLELDNHPQGAVIMKYLKEKYKHKT